MDEKTETAPADATLARSRFSRISIGGWLGCLAALGVTCAAVFYHLPLHHVSNVWYYDGLVQHIPAYYFLNETIHAFLRNPRSGFPMWSWGLGMGADTIGTLQWYVGDPFGFLGSLFPLRYTEYVYEVLYFLRLIAAGLAAYAYLLRMKARRLPAVIGSVTYVFVTYATMSALRHPFFANPMVWLPLLLLGTEKVLAKERPYLFIAAVFVAASSSFYFFYELTIIVVLYAIARYFEVTPRKDRWRRLGPMALSTAGYYALGTLMACVLLVPILAAFTTSVRSAEHRSLSLFFAFSQYRSFVVAILTPRHGGQSMLGGFSILGFLLLPVLLMRKGNRTVKFMLAAFLVFLSFPVFGSLFNGFAFPSYRFFFAAGMFLAVVSAALLSDPAGFSKKELVVMLGGLIVYLLLGLGARGRMDTMIVAVICLGGVMWLVLLAQKLANRGGATTWAGICLLALVISGAALAGYASFERTSVLSEYIRFGTVLKRYQTSAQKLAYTLQAGGAYRIDKQDVAYGSTLKTGPSNDPLLVGFIGLDYYYSMLNKNVSSYLNGLDNRNMGMAFQSAGLDDRASLDTLNGVQYYLASADATQYAPYGFASIERLGKTVAYRNQYALPIGYVYHSAVASSTYDSLSPLQKQEALLQGAVLADGVAPRVNRVSPKFDIVDVPYSITTSGTKVLDASTKTISQLKPGANIELHFAPVRDAELYVDLTGLSVRPGGTNPSQRKLAFGISGRYKSERVESLRYAYYRGDNSMLINLGYKPDGATHAFILPSASGPVRYQDLHVYAVPMMSYAEQVGRLRAEGMQDVVIHRNRVTGTVTSDGDGLLFLSIPYSNGWSATVDGKPAAVEVANVAFSGIPISNGTHRIELRYRTPGLVAGATLSLVGVLGVIVLVVISEIRARRARRRSDEATQEGALIASSSSAE